MSLSIKICGVRTPDMARVCADAGATHLGLVFFPKSPRHASVEEATAVAEAAGGLTKVGLFVDADHQTIERAVGAAQLDMLQLHGGETPDRVADLKAGFRLPVMKAIGVKGPADAARASDYKGAADLILFDAKPPKDASRPGGLGETFDWTVLKDAPAGVPWMLSGGLTPQNVALAIRAVAGYQGFAGVDVSSGVECAPGEKDAGLIREFVTIATAAMKETAS